MMMSLTYVSKLNFFVKNEFYLHEVIFTVEDKSVSQLTPSRKLLSRLTKYTDPKRLLENTNLNKVQVYSIIRKVRCHFFVF